MMTFGNALALALALTGASGIQIDVKPLSGPSQQCELTGIELDALVVVRDGQTQRLPLPSLWEVRAVAASQAPASLGSTWVELNDGSQLLASRYRVVGGSAAVGLLGGQEITVPTRWIRSVRFRDHSATPALASQWHSIAEEKHSADVIVIRRPESLDHLAGVLRDVTDQTAKFDFDGDVIDVNREKLDGLIYYHPLDRSLPDRICQVTDGSGSRWNARSLALVDGRIELTSPAGVQFAFPALELRKLDFSTGNIAWLSDLEPEFVERQPYVPSRLPETRLQQLFQPRRDVGLTGQPLMLDGVAYAKGLALASRTEMVFRLADDYRNFHAVVGIDDHVRDGGDVILIISGDDRELLRRTVVGREPAEAIDLDITGVKRLKILVDFGRGMDIADHLDLCDARITK